MIASAYSQRQRVEQGRRVVRDIAFAIALEKTERRLRLAARHGGEQQQLPSPGMACSASSAIASVSGFRASSASRSRATQSERSRAASSGKSGKDG